ncbi:MAG: caspase family protein [Burkholderiales bacterium]|nr:caspase family protein [Burkholderiales bacterium]
MLFAASPWARLWAQTPAGAQLLKLPKIALVIGNAAYRQAPLKNPANDAKGMAEALNGAGFEVTVRLDAGRAAMQAAVDAYVKQLAERKCVGLFYFAGHGIQINWKNYLLPADAQVASNEDVERQGIEVNAMAAGLARAGNALNLIILDACRDAPFGEARKPEQKGLSQMDAPRSTLLAYATAPGNVASDGEGANGLYTESLLREMKVADAKVEDVFKRVRLNVRRRSGGAQIPWESTSLEDDFWFVPPANLAPPTDRERAARFAEELKLWERVEAANTPEPFEDYLRRYPSGNFNELAQFRLDRVLAQAGERRIEIAPQANNPYATPTVRSDTAYRVGDLYVHRVSDIDSGQFRREMRRVVTAISDSEVVLNQGQGTFDLLGNPRRLQDGRQMFGAQLMPSEFAVGRAWTTRYNLRTDSGQDAYVEMHFRIVTREKVTVPAGTFECFRIEGKGVTRPYQGSWNTQLSSTRWLAPDRCRLPIKAEGKRVNFGPQGSNVLENDRLELIQFRQG